MMLRNPCGILNSTLGAGDYEYWTFGIGGLDSRKILPMNHWLNLMDTNAFFFGFVYIYLKKTVVL